MALLLEEQGETSMPMAIQTLDSDCNQRIELRLGESDASFLLFDQGTPLDVVSKEWIYQVEFSLIFDVVQYGFPASRFSNFIHFLENPSYFVLLRLIYQDILQAPS